MGVRCWRLGRGASDAHAGDAHAGADVVKIEEYGEKQAEKYDQKTLVEVAR